MILLIDNYDSFTYNLVQYLGELGGHCQVYRNDHIALSEIERFEPERIVISPGPCTPREAGISEKAILKMAGRMPILGVCLGHQCIGFAFGGRIIRTAARAREQSWGGSQGMASARSLCVLLRFQSEPVEADSGVGV